MTVRRLRPLWHWQVCEYVQDMPHANTGTGQRAAILYATRNIPSILYKLTYRDRELEWYPNFHVQTESCEVIKPKKTIGDKTKLVLLMGRCI